MTATADALMGIFGYKRVKPKRCRTCREHFEPRNGMHICCSAPCAISYALTQSERKRAKKEQQERKERREKLKKFRKLSWYHARTKTACNAYIRLRDVGKSCITCDTILVKAGNVGGDYDAGHFRTVAAAGHLQYDEANIHGQCKHCNDWGAGKQLVYQARIVERIGQAELDRLLNDNGTVKWTREMLEEIYQHYRAKAKELMKCRV